VAARVEQALLGQSARGDDADDRPPQHLGAAPLGLGGILDLVADRDLEPGPDQASEIGLGGVHRHPAHRDVGALVPAALGQRDVERPGGGDGILEKQLEEITHPEEQEAARVRLLDLMVLDHDRRSGGFGHRRAGLGWLTHAGV